MVVDNGMLDQVVPVDRQNWEDQLTSIDALVQTAVKEQDDTIIIGTAKFLISGIQLRGVTLAKLLYEWHQNTEQFGISQEDWIDHVKERIGRAEGTIYRYVDLWGSVFKKLEGTERFWMLLNKPIQGLLLLPAAVKEDQLTDADWEKIEQAPDPYSMREVVRAARGDATTSRTAIQLVLQRDGVLLAWRGDESSPVGYLNLDNGDQLADAAVTRIINAAGVRRE